jgi:hypothetical protein
MNRPGLLRLGSLLGLVVVVATSLACLGEGPVLTAGDDKDKPKEERKCDDVLGTAFISADERQWFLDNCSTWPVNDSIPQTPAQPARQEAPECGAMRGKPYESSEQRAWFLQNCTDAGTRSAQPSSGPDRTNCNEIRGTQYRSTAERNWYLTNCGFTGGPDRTNCDDIRGTPYRSAAERAWYLTNCVTRTNQVPQHQNTLEDDDDDGPGNGNGNRRGRGNNDDDDD